MIRIARTLPAIFLPAALLLVLAAPLPALAQTGDGAETARIRIQAGAQDSARADVVEARFTLLSRAAKPRDALAELDRKTAALNEKLRALQLDPATLRLVAASLRRVGADEPLYSRVIGGSGDSAYGGRRSYEIILPHGVALAPLAARLIEDTGEDFQGYAFSLSDDAARMDRLRVKAAAEARRRAELHLEGAQAKLGRLLLITPRAETGRQTPDDGLDLPVSKSKVSAPVGAGLIEPPVITLEVALEAVWEAQETRR